MDDMRHVNPRGIWWGYVRGVPQLRRELTFLCAQTLRMHQYQWKSNSNVLSSLNNKCTIRMQERTEKERVMHRKKIPNKSKAISLLYHNI